MCVGPFRQSTPTPPPPPPLAPPPPPPAAPIAPLPEPDPLVTDVNPQVRRARSKKVKNQSSKGTRGLRIKLNKDPAVNTGTDIPAGGTNI